MIEKLADVIRDCRYVNRSSEEIAAAVLDLCGPKPLVWGSTSATCSSCNEYDIFRERGVWAVYEMGGRIAVRDTLEAAQSAAQAHADAAHWANTKMGDL